VKVGSRRVCLLHCLLQTTVLFPFLGFIWAPAFRTTQTRYGFAISRFILRTSQPRATATSTAHALERWNCQHHAKFIIWSGIRRNAHDGRALVLKEDCGGWRWWLWQDMLAHQLQPRLFPRGEGESAWPKVDLSH
jgi:hypothetical protein